MATLGRLAWGLRSVRPNRRGAIGLAAALIAVVVGLAAIAGAVL
jgi:hypothetical protein